MTNVQNSISLIDIIILVFPLVLMWWFGCSFDVVKKKTEVKVVSTPTLRRKRVSFDDDVQYNEHKRIRRASIPTPPIQMGKVGDRVVAKWPKWKSGIKNSPWFSGVITEIDFTNKTCQLHYDDDGKACVNFDDIWIAPEAPKDVGKKDKHSVDMGGDGGNHRYSNLKKMLSSYPIPFPIYPVMFDDE